MNSTDKNRIKLEKLNRLSVGFKAGIIDELAGWQSHPSR
jgi:hypothetical protein